MGDNFQNIEKIINFFLERGYTKSQALHFYRDNFEFINSFTNLEEHMYFIYNSFELYGILIVNENEYKCSIYHNGIFQKIEGSEELKKYQDCVVQIIIEFLNSEKLKRMIPEVEDLSLEYKIKKIKNMNMNSYGYHLK